MADGRGVGGGGVERPGIIHKIQNHSVAGLVTLVTQFLSAGS